MDSHDIGRGRPDDLRTRRPAAWILIRGAGLPSYGGAMKLRVLIGSVLWTVLITLMHIQINVGWSGFAREMRVFFGLERPELVVGFLPVT